MSAADVAATARRTLGRTGLSVSPLALGAWGWGGQGPEPTRVDSEEEVLEILKAAFAAGVNFINTAEAYQNEEIIGRVLADAAPPEDLVVATAYGHGEPMTEDAARRAVDAALARLGLDVLPLMYLHEPLEEWSSVVGAGGALQGLRRAQDEGLLGHVGVATGALGVQQNAVSSGEIDVIQFPRLFTLVNDIARSSGLIADARGRGIGTVAAAPFGGNLLAGGREALYVYEPASSELAAARERLEAAGRAEGIALKSAAIAYVAGEELIDSTIVGVASVSQVRENCDALRHADERDVLERIAAAAQLDPRFVGGPSFQWATEVVPFWAVEPEEAAGDQR
jgi:D-threo-aldose 1-dehydrogenase